MAEEFWRRPKEQIYKSRIRLHVMATVMVIVVLTSIWPLLLFPYMEERIGMTEGYHHGPDYSEADTDAFLLSIYLTVILVIMGISYLRRMKKMLRADPYIPSDRPAFLILAYSSIAAALVVTLIFYLPAFCFLSVAIVAIWLIYLALPYIKKDRK